ncbi:MAG: glycoside hydrolase family 66 protein [Tidjanibacter sp.]|nr:glycoside hydrolase family 66 protein [Tidjanibacter sp.]
MIFHKTLSVLIVAAALLSGCGEPDNNASGGGTTIVRMVTVTTDKARYSPGETVCFTLDKSIKAKVRYYHLGKLLGEESLSGSEWTWTPPTEDFKGYMVELYNSSVNQTVGSVAVDVSSDWTRFPRYGFLSDFSLKTRSQIESVVEFLNSCHINGLQYYDWMYDHHHPLAGTVANPESSWLDIIGRTNYRQTISDYIDAAHTRGIASMWYDLCYGALEWAERDGASWRWGVYKDSAHSQLDYHPLPAFRSNIYLMNPSNQDWLDYFAARADEVYEVFDFDGFHIDQLGSRGTRYDYNGQRIDLPAGYGKFIDKMKSAQPDKQLAFNAVSRYGQNRIAAAQVDFLYNEVWTTSFDELKTIIDENATLSDAEKNTVLAAYMNYNKSPKSGEFNSAAVLLADAVIFALGGSHLELGEHMLCSEYFPNSDLSMSSELRKSIVAYYDFLTAYENLLRDGMTETTASVTSRTDGISLCGWAPQRGKVLCLTKSNSDCEVVHLLNFVDAVHTDWRDDAASQPTPNEITDLSIRVGSARSVKNVWAASPDIDGGVPHEVDYSVAGNFVSLKVPSLKYWTMIVIE